MNPSPSSADPITAEERIRISNGEGAGPSFHRSSRARWMALALGLVLVAVAVLLWRHYTGWESTDDAQIEGHINPISARVGGHVTSVKVHENEYVDAGTVVVELDPRDYQVAVDRARAEYANAVASAAAAHAGVPITSVSTTSQVSTSESGVENARAALAAAEQQAQAAEARVAEAQAHNTKAQADLNRYRQLVGKQEISGQQYDQAIAAAKASEATVTADQAQAQAAAQQVSEARGRLAQAEAELRSARTGPQQVSMTRSRAAAADAAVQMAKAALEQAELNLQYTTITAPLSGLVGKKSVEVGQNVMLGQALMALVPLDDIWVTANFKETQLRNMRPGQHVKIHVDAYDHDYDGYVESLAGATGADFSLLPPENATGNYVKVVQRVPVRIRFDKGQDPQHLLRLGMSVEPKVRTN
ncbi:MAG TPA: HlyD family secretion protein [Terriglobia bacterium]|nr:HlyD family secretion protein [Terriglobia bacterium]